MLHSQKAEITDKDVEKAIDCMQNYYAELYRKSEIDKELNHKFMERLVKLSLQNLQEIDLIIQKNLHKEHAHKDTNEILKAILRSGICEMLHFKTPLKVSLNEHVKISKSFFKSEEAGFINALLDKAMKQMEGKT